MKLFGIPVKVEGSFWLMCLFLAYGRINTPVFMLEWAAVVFFSILIHEFGHALAGRRFGLTPEIKLYAMGGVTMLGSDRQLHPMKDIFISLAGPLMGFSVGGVVYLSSRFLPTMSSEETNLLLQIIVRDLLWVNLAWGVFNLLPILPMDGGLVLRRLESWWKKRDDEVISRAISLTLAIAVMTWALTAGYAWVALLVGWFGWTNGEELLRRWRERADEPLRAVLERGMAEYRQEKFADADREFTLVFEKARSHNLQRRALELMISSWLAMKNFVEAEKQYRIYRARFGSDAYIEGYLLLVAEKYEEAIGVFTPAFEAAPGARLGEVLILALVKAKKLPEALGVCGHTALSQDKQAILYSHLQLHFFAEEDYATAITVGEEGFAKTQVAELAYNIGCALSLLEKPHEALIWLERAVQAGYVDKEHLSGDPDLVNVRVLPEFGAFFERVGVAEKRCRGAEVKR